jgi:phosphopantetheinyl transferase
MGVLFTRKVDGPAELGIWKITENAEELLSQIVLSQEEQLLYASFRTETRRNQWLAYRRLIKELISPQRYPVHYDESGKPFLAGTNWNISVTHTEDYAGVIISHKLKVGIDMELLRPRIDRIKEKFLSQEELSFLSAEKYLEQLTLAWCAKEAIYKLYGYRNLDFRKNIKVYVPDNMNVEYFFGEIILPGAQSSYKLFQEWTGDLVVVWAMETGQERMQ